MATQLRFYLRVNRDPLFVHMLINSKKHQHIEYIRNLFMENALNSLWIEDVEIVDKPVQPYTSIVDFLVYITTQLDLYSLWRNIIATWKSPDIWLSPADSQSISDHPEPSEPPNFMDFDLSFFSFGTVINGYRYIRCTRQLSLTDLLDISYSRVVVRFSLNNKFLHIYYLYGCLHCIELSWPRDFEKRVIVCEDHVNQTVRLYLQLRLLPKLYWAESFEMGNLMIDSNMYPREYLEGDKFFRWVRLAEFLDCQKEIIGNCTTIELAIAKKHQNSIQELLMYLKEFGLQITYCQMEELLRSQEHVWTALFTLSKRHFEIFWALKTLHSGGYFAIETIEREQGFKDIITKFMHDSCGRQRLQKALDKVASLIETERYINILAAFKHYLSIDHQVPEITYKGLEYIRSVVITPLRVILYPSMPVMSNRMLREHSPDHFLRVTYRDEDMNQIMAINEDFFQAVVQSHIAKPMTISDRDYYYLACSNSQLRSHSVWFYSADSNGMTAELIRSKLGDFSQQRNVASLISRMGQCFSNTKRGVTAIDQQWLKYIPDIEHNGYCFSDGTGMISPELRDEVAKTLGHRPHSLYQIRFGGCKGTVALNTALDGKQLLIRESMKKFSSDHADLEICKEADACRLHLNHQSIMLLEQLGVPSHIFLSLQEEALFNLLDMMLYEDIAAAMLDTRTIADIKFKQLVKQGVSLITDKFFRKVLLLLLYKTIDSIKTNGRIELPSEYGRNLMGTVDVTETLEYGQVFVQYSKNFLNKGEELEILTGDVIITKFPAVHVGDMRRLVAVDVPALHHLADCIVFPSKGPRPHTDEMAGSDLDGDEYFVTWLPDFLDTFQKENQPAMDYTCTKKTTDRPIELNDQYEYITNYIRNDNLGKISNALKAVADTEKDGFFSLKCQILAKKHSMAVDFPKTEIPVTLDQDEIVTKYPDFMGKQGISWVYNSKRVLGRMYRVCCNLTDLIDDCFHGDRGYIDVVQMPQICVPQKLEVQTNAAYNNYVNGLRDIMQTYGIDSEEELISGKVVSLHRRFSEKRELYSTVDIVRTIVSQYRSHFRKLFFTELGITEEPEELVITKAMRVKAISWYNKVYCSKQPEFLSFAWIVSDVLGDVMKDKVRQVQTGSDRVTESVCSVYNEIPKSPIDPSMKVTNLLMNKALGVIVQSFPGIVPIWAFLWLWCKKQKCNYNFVRKNLDKFLERKYSIVLPCLDEGMYNKFNVLKSYVDVKDIKQVKIGGASIGQVLLTFLRYHGSQQYLIADDEVDLLAAQKAKKFHHQALRAYFHMAVFSECRELVHPRSHNSPKIAERNTNIILPSHIWCQVRIYLDVFKRDLKACFPSLRTINITRQSRGKNAVGAIFAVGYFEDINLLERTINAWMEIFKPQRTYIEDIKSMKDRQ